MIWVGVDPGPRHTGITARDGVHLIGWRVVDRHDTEPGTNRPGRTTLDSIVSSTITLGTLTGDGRYRVAVEDTVPPSSHIDGHLSIIDVTALLRAAEIVGYLEKCFPDAVRVRPAHNGSNALASYPAGLVTPGERRYALARRRLLEPAPQNTNLRHARSAWDVAGAGPGEERLAAAIAKQAVALAARPPRERRRTLTP